MMLDLNTANSIISAALAHAEAQGFMPLTVVVLDARGTCKAMQSQDGSSLLRFEVAHGKAFGAVGLGMGSRAIFERAEQQPYFVGAVNGAAKGALIPVPGGVLIKNADGELLGAVGISGDNSDNDEAAAVAGIESTGLAAIAG